MFKCLVYSQRKMYEIANMSVNYIFMDLFSQCTYITSYDVVGWPIHSTVSLVNLRRNCQILPQWPRMVLVGWRAVLKFLLSIHVSVQCVQVNTGVTVVNPTHIWKCYDTNQNFCCSFYPVHHPYLLHTHTICKDTLEICIVQYRHII